MYLRLASSWEFTRTAVGRRAPADFPDPPRRPCAPIASRSVSIPMILRKVLILCGWQLMSVRTHHGSMRPWCRSLQRLALAFSATPCCADDAHGHRVLLPTPRHRLRHRRADRTEFRQLRTAQPARHPAMAPKAAARENWRPRRGRGRGRGRRELGGGRAASAVAVAAARAR